MIQQMYLNNVLWKPLITTRYIGKKLISYEGSTFFHCEYLSLWERKGPLKLLKKRPGPEPAIEEGYNICQNQVIRHGDSKMKK